MDRVVRWARESIGRSLILIHITEAIRVDCLFGLSTF